MHKLVKELAMDGVDVSFAIDLINAAPVRGKRLEKRLEKIHGKIDRQQKELDKLDTPKIASYISMNKQLKKAQTKLLVLKSKTLKMEYRNSEEKIVMLAIVMLKIY